MVLFLVAHEMGSQWTPVSLIRAACPLALAQTCALSQRSGPDPGACALRPPPHCCLSCRLNDEEATMKAIPPRLVAQGTLLNNLNSIEPGPLVTGP